MGKQELARVIGLAIVDSAFRKKLLKNPQPVIKAARIALGKDELALFKENGAKRIIDTFAEMLGVEYDGTGKGR